MKARALIDQARADGLELRSNGDKLKLLGPEDVVERWKPRIIASKAAILAALSEIGLSAPISDFVYSKPEIIAQAEPEPASTCSTCAHETGRGGCGEPAAAGLSNLDGVIRYHEDGGEDCPVFLSIIQPDLERRILAMAERWNYAGDDLAIALAGARSDPTGWNKVLEADENEGEK
jgi:hypothetical protein